MDTSRNPLDWLRDHLPAGEARDFLLGPGGWAVLGVVALVLLLLAWLVLRKIWRSLFARKSAPPPNPDRALEEFLAEYPLAGPPGRRQLTVEGVPVRVRLVVVAPMGKQHTVNAGDVEMLLEQVLRGVGEVMESDRPRIRLWPAQLSNHGFAVKFHRLTHRPEADDEPSHWILVAGQTPARPRPLLVGMALYANEANLVGRLTLEPGRWIDMLRVVKTADL